MMDVANPLVERELPAPGEPELYNIHDDPHESRDLAQQEPDRLARMKKELETWFESVEADRRSIESSMG